MKRPRIVHLFVSLLLCSGGQRQHRCRILDMHMFLAGLRNRTLCLGMWVYSAGYGNKTLMLVTVAASGVIASAVMEVAFRAIAPTLSSPLISQV